AFGGGTALDRKRLHVRGPSPADAAGHALSAGGELTPVVPAPPALPHGCSRLPGIGHLRRHDTDRLAALTKELGDNGVDVAEHPDALTITGTADLRPALWHTYHDHRMVMAGAILALRNRGLIIENAGTVAKTL